MRSPHTPTTSNEQVSDAASPAAPSAATTTELWQAYQWHRAQALSAHRSGKTDTARVYFLEAARSVAELANRADSSELREARQATARRLLDLARDCTRPRRSRPSAAPTRPSADTAVADSSQQPADTEEPQATQWLVREKPSVRFADVAGLDDVKQEIRLRMVYPLAHPEAAQRFGVKPGGGVLLYGPPGTGKTMLAKATAGELDAAFYTVSAADVLSKWVGQAEQNIKALFEAAANEPRAVVFIDEIESLIPARGDDSGGSSGVMQRVVPQILQGMEGFGKRSSSVVLFMGATNVPWQLDPAVLRPGRFDEKILVPLPDLPARRKLLELYLQKRPLADDVNLDALADRLDGYSGADIKYLCDRAAIVPFLQTISGTPAHHITAETIASVLNDIKPSVSPEQAQRFHDWAATAG